MSLAHVRFIRLESRESEALYSVESTDFTESKEWVPVGTLRLDKLHKQYEFAPSSIWSEKEALPPSFYALSEAEQKRLLEGRYRGFGWGTWAMIINEYAMQFLNKGNYPEHHPPLFFRKPGEVT